MFKSLPLAVWHGLSDVTLAEAMENRASVRRFCGPAACEATPERGRTTNTAHTLRTRAMPLCVGDGPQPSAGSTR